MFILGLFVFPCFSQEVNQKVTLESKVPEPYDKDLLSPAFHKDRRQQLRSRMDPNSVAILFAGPVRNRSNDVNYEYHQDPNFYYFTGLQEPNAMLLIFSTPVEVEGEKVKEVIFVPERDPASEVWDGKRLGTEGAVQVLGIEKALTSSAYHSLRLKWKMFKTVYTLPQYDDVRDNPTKRDDLFSLKAKTDIRLDGLENIDKKKLTYWCAELREIKQEEEIRLLSKAIDITCEAQHELMKAIHDTMKEYEAEALVEYIFKKNGAEYPGFPSILGSGENTCILHYTTSRRPMTKNDLLVCDIGAEYHGYTADVTRTLPANGKYSYEQATIYNIVLEAQQAGIDVCLSGKRFWDPNIAATSVLSKRMKELGIIKNASELRRYFMHGTSHYLGLDVHDVGGYGPLEEGQVITVEPGIYIPEGSPCDPKWWNIGVRIEDDILITNDKPVNLSGCVPRKIGEIEAVMLEKSVFYQE